MIRALAITGPTASGKTALAIEVARTLGCEIISLDSMQIYRKMNIGTAKATADEQAAVPHHLIDIVEPNENFSAEQYKAAALEVAREISERGKIPLFVGGTGLYLSTLLRPECEKAPGSDREYRERIEAGVKTEEDRIALWERLKAVDPESADAIHYNNLRRVIRALEIYDATGKTKTYFDALTKMPSDEISVKHVTIDYHRRQTLYERIDARVDLMRRDGLYDEVKSLLDSGTLTPDSTAAQAIGYKELVLSITEGTDPEAAYLEIKQASRNYAKRQITWFKHNIDSTVLFADTEDGRQIPKSELCKKVIEIFTK